MEEFVVSYGSGVESGNGIDTYAGIVSTIGDWLDRDDLSSKIPHFIALFEQRLNRILRVPEMEERATVQNAVTADPAELYKMDLPTDFLQARSLINDDGIELEQVPPTVLHDAYGEQDGEPCVYSIIEGQIQLAPRPTASYSATLTYYEKIPVLSDSNTSNWLLASHADIYLYGALTMAEAYLANDERIGLWKSALEEAIAELQSQGLRKAYGKPLRFRASSSA